MFRVEGLRLRAWTYLWLAGTEGMERHGTAV